MAEYTYTCQHCGDAVLSPRRRSGAVNCAPCAQMKTAAAKAHTFAALASAMEAATRYGLTGAAYRAYVVPAAAVNLEAARCSSASRRAPRAQAAATRTAQNALLHAHGYRWVKVAVGSEDAWAGPGSLYGGTGEATGDYWWNLVAPDGRSVALAEALAVIQP